MKILDLAEFYSERGGGVRSYLTKLTRAAGARGHEVVVVAPGPRDEVIEDEGSRIIRFEGPPMPYDPTYNAPLRVDRMRALVQQERPDVLQISSPFIPSLVARTLRDIPVKAYFYHSDPIGCYVQPPVKKWLPASLQLLAMEPAYAYMRGVCNSCDMTITAGHWLAERLRQHGCQRVVTVPFGISHDEFGPDRRNESLRSELLGPIAHNPDSKLLLVTGRLAMDKRQALVVEAIQKVARTRPVALMVLGDGPERAKLEQMATTLPHATFMSFTRDRRQYAEILASADALCHGSVGETYGFVIAETLASGTPVVVPDDGGAPALVEPGCAEMYSSYAGPDAVADAIHRLLDRPRAEMSQFAAKLATRQPSMDEHFDGLFALYERAVADRRRQR